MNVEETVEQRKARLALLRNKAKGINNDNNNNNNDNNDNNNNSSSNDIVIETSNDIIKEELAKMNSDELNIVPQKVNWDLKNGINDKVNKLKKRTQKAIVDILRDKINQEKDE